MEDGRDVMKGAEPKTGDGRAQAGVLRAASSKDGRGARIDVHD